MLCTNFGTEMLRLLLTKFAVMYEIKKISAGVDDKIIIIYTYKPEEHDCYLSSLS